MTCNCSSIANLYTLSVCTWYDNHHPPVVAKLANLKLEDVKNTLTMLITISSGVSVEEYAAACTQSLYWKQRADPLSVKEYISNMLKILKVQTGVNSHVNIYTWVTKQAGV